MKKIALVPFVFGAAASTPGCERGPVVMKEKGLAQDLQKAGFDAHWYDDPAALYDAPDGAAAHARPEPHGSAGRTALVNRACLSYAARVAAAVRDGFYPVMLGGDHAMAAGSIAGVARAHDAVGRIGVLWIDAHPDINTPDTSESQALHGMPIAALLGEGATGMAGLSPGDTSILRPENLYYLGIRDIDAGEADAMARLGIHGLTARQVHEIGYEEALARAMKHLARHADILFLSLDLDVFEPDQVPAVGTPVPEGFDHGAFLPALCEILRRHDFAAFEIAEYNPTLPGADKTYKTFYTVLTAMLAAIHPEAVTVSA